MRLRPVRLRVTQGDLSCVFIEFQCLEYIENNVDYLAELFLELVRTAEQVCIILCETADSCQTVQLSALFVTVNRTEFSVSQWQILV